MKVISPYFITDENLVSSTVPENEYLEWSVSTAYTAGQTVISVHKIYECMIANTGALPADNISGTTPKWLGLGATNQWKMFDQKVGTRTSSTGTIEVALALKQVVPAVALLELDAVAVTVSLTDPLYGIVYDKTVDLLAPLSTPSWWSYFFEPITRNSTAIFDDLPSYKNATVSIAISSGVETESVQCGVCLLGIQRKFSDGVAYGARVGIQDYSIKETDVFGNVSIVERSYSKKATWSFLLNNSDLDSYQNLMASLRAKPALYIGSGLYSSTMIYGFFRDFDTIISYPTESECSIEIEGLI